ncbi:hypothetical protein SAMN06273572_1152 [Monaibacterium marinum]|uniref:Uncharacterized protein n=1 Tax=Pontivivens marinum TaxID=1690039 RepID=A0A2C9CYV9_9RHOB|nr:hypothetical protein SAMN06273572_1152 [Monaibacterium marinum]
MNYNCLRAFLNSLNTPENWYCLGSFGDNMHSIYEVGEFYRVTFSEKGLTSYDERFICEVDAIFFFLNKIIGDLKVTKGYSFGKSTS